MTETEQQSPPPQFDTESTAKFSIWPPNERTRDAVRNRLIETLSTPSALSKRYGTVSREEAVEVAKRIEEEAYEAAGEATDTDGDEIKILQVYSKEISKKMLDTMKAKTEEEKEAEFTFPTQSKKVDSVAGDE